MNVYSLIKNTFFTGVLMMFITSMYPWFVWNNNLSFYSCVYTMVIGFVYYFTSKSSFNKPSTRTVYFLLFSALAMFWSARVLNMNGQITYLVLLIVLWIIIHLRSHIVKEILNFITKYMAFLLLISMLFHIAYLLGVSIIPPSVVQYDDGRYISNNYYFFLAPYNSSLEFYRFRSIFMEPGHMTMGVVPLIVANRFDLKNKYIVILFVAELLSFSLAGYVVMLFAYILFNVGTKNINRIISGSIFILIAIWIMYLTNNGDLLDKYLWSRLEYSNGTLSGDNRVSNQFQTVYQNILHSSYLLTGNVSINPEIFGAVAGFKRYLVCNGIIGIILVLAMYMANSLFLKNKKYHFILFGTLVLLLFQNAYPFWYCVLITYLLSAYNTDTHNL